MAASDGNGDHVAGHDSTAVLQVESARPSAEDVTAQPNPAGGAGSEFQVNLSDRISVPPPGPRDVARLEDVLTIAPKADRQGDPSGTTAELPIRVESRVSVPPPARRPVARLEDVLTVSPAEDAPEIAPKTAAAAASQLETEVESVTQEDPEAEVRTVPAEEVQVPSSPARPSDDPTYVPAYALRAAFWFEQASAFESSSDDDEDDQLPTAAAPEVEVIQQAADVLTSQVAAEVPVVETQVRTPRNHWILSLCLLALAGLVIVLTGRRPCRCSCKSAS